jgi:hypothetical protein
MLQAASGATTAHLHAAMWEFRCGGAAVPARVAEELRALPPRALSAMVHRTPLSIANGVVRNLASLPAALGQATEVCQGPLCMCALCTLHCASWTLYYDLLAAPLCHRLVTTPGMEPTARTPNSFRTVNSSRSRRIWWRI